jgi:hypothetical protein
MMTIAARHAGLFITDRKSFSRGIDKTAGLLYHSRPLSKQTRITNG